MKLSKNFNLYEFEKSMTADRLEIDNSIPKKLIPNIQALVQRVLQPIRDQVKKRITINSGYRSAKVNRALNSKSTSQHRKAQAADFEVPGISNRKLFELIENSDIPYDQLILEFHKDDIPTSGWVHISYRLDGNNRFISFEIPKK